MSRALETIQRTIAIAEGHPLPKQRSTENPKIAAFGDIYTALTIKGDHNLQSTLWRGIKSGRIHVLQPPTKNGHVTMRPLNMEEGTIVYINKDAVPKEGTQGKTRKEMDIAPAPLILATAYGQTVQESNMILVGGIKVPHVDPFWGVHTDRHQFSTFVEGAPGCAVDNRALSFRIEDRQGKIVFSYGDYNTGYSTTFSPDVFYNEETRPDIISTITTTLSEITKDKFPSLSRFLVL